MECDDAIVAIMIACEDDPQLKKKSAMEQVQDLGCMYALIL